MAVLITQTVCGVLKPHILFYRYKASTAVNRFQHLDIFRYIYHTLFYFFLFYSVKNEKLYESHFTDNKLRLTIKNSNVNQSWVV